MDFNIIEDLIAYGFECFHPISRLRKISDSIPYEKGVYLVINPDYKYPQFLKKGSGGYYQDTPPNVTIEKLEKNYLYNAKIQYIGRAGKLTNNGQLNERLNLYLEYGNGKPVMHTGGKLIWQLKNHEGLIICWKKLIDICPANTEAQLQQDFIDQFGRLPFANLRKEKIK